MQSSDSEELRRLCCCGSQLEPFEKFRQGKSIGYFCVECVDFRMKTFLSVEVDEDKNDEVGT